MNELFKILSIKAKTIKNHIVRYRGSKFKLIFITIFVILFLAGIYALFMEGFNFLKGLPIIGALLMNRLVYFLLMLSFFILIFSNIVVAYSTIYTGEELNLLFSLPLHERTIFLQKLTESFIFASWAFVFIWFPFLASYGKTNGVPWYFYPLNLCFPIFFLLICTLLGTVVTMVFTTTFSTEKWKFYTLGIMLACIPLVYLAYKLITFPKFGILSGAGELEVYLFQLLRHFRLSQHPYLPSFWLSKIFISLAKGDFLNKETLYFLMLLMGGTFLLFFVIVYVLVPKLYHLGWSYAQGGRRVRKYSSTGGLVNRMGELLRFLPVYARALILKDIKNFLRDPKQWSQFLIFFGIMWLYAMNLRSYLYHNLTPYWRIITAFLNLSAIGLILSALTTRFMFPLISLEGKSIWILGLSPIGMSKVLVEKFYFTFFFALILSEPLVLVFTKMLRLHSLLVGVFLVSALLMSFTVSSLAIGLGAIFPDFKSENPAKIVSGFGGTLCFVLGMCYVIGSSLLLASPFYLFMVEASIMRGVFTKWLIFSVSAITVVSAIIGWTTLGIASRNLRSLEI